MSLKGLVRGWRLVDSSGDGFKVLDIEYPRVEITVPADYVEGMVIQEVLAEPFAHLNAHFEFTALCVSLQVFRQANITFAVRRVLEHLAELISIAFWGFDL